MKSKKKGFNAKTFLVQHAEKLGFGLIAMTVVGIWASEFFGGAWSRERRSPEALILEIDKKKSEIDSPSNTWPVDKQAEFKPINFSERATELLRPIDSSKYELSTELFVPLNRPKEKAREAEYLAVEELMAMPGHVILAVMSEEEMRASQYMDDDDPTTDPDDSEMESEEEGDDFTRRDNRAGTRGGDVAIGGLIGNSRDDDDGDGDRRFGFGLSGPPKGRKPRIAPGALESGGKALVGQPDAFKQDRGKRTRRGLSGQSPAGRFYTSVRGVWPINKQLDRIQRALHLPTRSAALDYLELLDFDLERQVASQGDDPWSKPWEKIDVSRAMEILKEVDGFDDEPLDMEVFDPVITMPLPMRAFGVWTEAATHPRIKNYLLTPEGKEREKMVMARLLEEEERMKAQLDKMRKPSKKGGFTSQSHDFRMMATDMVRANAGEMKGVMRDLSQNLRNTVPGGQANLTEEALRAKVTAVGQLLLFRYLDFDVRPGYAYRYRVKLKLRNPNFERAVTEVADPSYAEGEFRETPYSNVSNVAVMPMSPRYFLHSIERNPLADEGHKSRSVASVSMFEWHKELGTQVSSVLELTSLGQFVGGEKEIEILDVTVPELDDQVYPFASEDVLLDVHPDAELLPEQHPDLNLETKKNNKAIELQLIPEAIVLNSGGELKILEGGRDTADERALRARQKAERKAFEGLTKREDQPTNPLDGGAGAGINMLRIADDDDQPAGGKNRRANPRRKGSRGGAEAVGMPIGGAANGYGAPARSGSKSKRKGKDDGY